MSECFVSGVSAKIALYKYSSFPFLLLWIAGIGCCTCIWSGTMWIVMNGCWRRCVEVSRYVQCTCLSGRPRPVWYLDSAVSELALGLMCVVSTTLDMSQTSLKRNRLFAEFLRNFFMNTPIIFWIFSSAGGSIHINFSKCCLCVCLDVNQGGTYRNRCTQRLVILCAHTY